MAEAKQQATLRIRKDADTAGIRPQDLNDKGEDFTICPNDDGFCVTVEERTAKKGGKFQQYNLHLCDMNGNKRRLGFLFESHLAPLARAFGDDPTQWDGKDVTVIGFKDGQNWNVEVKPR